MCRFIFAFSLALVASVHAAQFKIGAHNFTLPDGFEIELIAGTNLVPRPIEADFDEHGRLYVTDSSGSNDKVEKQLAEKPHRVVRLEDTDGDGRFDKSITFADKMMLPEGAMWLDGSLYVAAPPSIWKLTDTNSDGVADVRMEWFQGKTLTGCANDLHGPYAGPDGWIYWCKGAFAKQTYTLPNGKEFNTRASHIFRARPDGTGVEPVMTGGMDNPVGLAFTPEGERILSGTFFQNPEGGKRDGLIHALYGGVYGKVNDVLEGHPRTGDLLPMMTHLGAAAPAGLMRYESDVFGKDFQNNLFVACFNMHKIVRCVMEPSGATYKTADTDFLVSDNTDFHPTDVLEDADGSLIVVDTGGWYKLCCPTSQLQKPDVLGGIYRVRRTAARKLEDPRGLKITWSSASPEEITSHFGEERPAVRRRAIAEAGKRTVEAMSKAIYLAMTNGVSTETRRDAVWASSQQSLRREAAWSLAFGAEMSAQQRYRALAGAAPYSSASSGAALDDRDSSVVLAAIHAESAERSAPEERMFQHSSASVRRAAVEWRGRNSDRDEAGIYFSRGILKLAEDAVDRAYEHSLIYGLIELNEPEAVRKSLTSDNAHLLRVALVALDQMHGTNLFASDVVPLLASTNALLEETAMWISGHHPEWGGEIARWIQDWFKPISSTVGRPQFADILARGAAQVEVQQRLAQMAGQPASQATALSAMTRSRLKEIPDSWMEAVRAGLRSKWGVANQRLAISAANSFASAKKDDAELNTALLSFARDRSHAKNLRLNALAALPGSAIASDASTFDFLRAGLSPVNSIADRGAAASVLAKARLSESQLLALAESVKDVGPIELPKLLGAFTRATNENIGIALVTSLEKSKLLASLRAETVKPHLTNFPAVVQQKAEALLNSLNTDAAQQKKHIDEMVASVKGGDVRRGQAIFNSPKAACSACHAIGYLGGKVGPDLTKIGQIRNERDLLEAIVYPSVSFVRSYEPLIVATKSGEEFNGVLRKDAADEVVLATGPNTEQRIARADISDMRPGNVSVMPSGLAEQLTKEEIADLLAFLKATR
jgi:putative heme-binding domain-containing protein